MGKAKWWVCNDCKSLNDLPASKCFSCRIEKPDRPTLIDDQYGEVGGGTKRVGITVDLNKVGDLSRPDPIEKQESAGIMEAFGEEEDEPTVTDSLASRMAASAPSQPESPPPPPPLRDPTPRGISAVGGRDWTQDMPPLPPEGAAAPSQPPTQAPPPPPMSAPSQGQAPQGQAPHAPQAGQAPAPGQTSPPPPAGAPPPPPQAGQPMPPPTGTLPPADTPAPPGYAPVPPPVAPPTPAGAPPAPGTEERPPMSPPPGAPMPPPSSPPSEVED